MSGPTLNKIIILGALLFIVGLFFFFDLGRYLSLKYLKESQVRFQQLYEQHSIAVLGSYMVIYVAVTALSLLLPCSGYSQSP
ncbi:MAG: hypothetical protein HKN69_05980 [Desulfofustis sp.]|nr:hypothetical protein [Desulfofustis sp.]